MTDADQRHIRPVGSAEANRLAREEARRFLALARSLRGDEWDLPTDCTLWDVRKIVLHQVGEAECWVSFREFFRQYLPGLAVAARMRGMPVDGANEVSIAARSHLRGQEIADRLELAQRRFLDLRQRGGPPLVSAIPLPAGPTGWVTVGRLYRVIFTRDAWMHRIDICRATRRELELTPEHDGSIVGDIVAEWARRHARPFHLELTGVAGGAFEHGEGGPRYRLDAVEFARIVSGRGHGEGLLATPVLF